MEAKIDIDKEVLLDLEKYLAFIKSQWDSKYPKKSHSISKSYIFESTSFIISVLDDLINYAQLHIQGGETKKAVVLSASCDIFNHIVESVFPIWLKPFAPLIKEIVVNIIINNLIEFIVKKYKEGAWKRKNNPPDELQKSIIYISNGGLDG